MKKAKPENKKVLEPYSREREEEIKSFWKAKGIPEKARKANAKAGKKYYFMDGPPYATGHIHMGTALNKVMKDFAVRSKRMQGLDVFDRPGYDTHGLPIENKVEQKLGFSGKQDIEKFGVGKFVEECRKFATEHIGTMNDEFADLGVWMDWENPYLTLSDDYIEAIWWTFKKADEKGLLYKGIYPVHVCPRCETAVAYNEIEYTKQTDTSVYVKFKVKGEENAYLIIWTTTPWTLPGNTGVMVNPKFDYAYAGMSNGERWIMAKELIEKFMQAAEAGYAIEKVVKGKELEGIEYENPLAKNLKLPKLEKAYRVILSERYVNLDEGSGLVHTAPGHGKEDFDAGSKAGLPAISPLKLDGTMTAEAGKYAGKKARQVDGEIIADLEGMNALVYKHPHTHDYPICWRCKNPLLMLSVPQWFFRISSIQERMLELNKEVKWVPERMGARMQNWLEQLGDWPISRARYWGTPLPIWVCGKCGERKVIGSIEELKKEAGLEGKIELHKPEIDEVKIRCKCGGEMKRVPEVLDVWFDAGVSSWAALGYPKNEKLFRELWPADLNLEGPDQFRGWWNAELITSTIAFGKKPFKAIVVHGTVLDLEKKKMSKSLGNVIQPRDIVEKYNRDYLRYYLAGVSRGDDILFGWDVFKDINRFFNTFWNVYNYAALYLELDAKNAGKANAKGLEIEDKWLLSRVNSLVKEALEHYNNYEFFRLLPALENFVLEDFSRTYIKLIRDRVGSRTQKGVEKVAGYAIVSLLKLLAPITPHITEYIYQDLRKKGMAESVHLLEMPAADKKLIDKGLEKEFGIAREITQAVLAMREENKLRLRWPLKELVVQSKTGKELKKVKPVLASMCNVKKVSEAKGKPKGNYAEKEFGKLKLYLSLDADEKLKEEWELMELRRRIQEKRKEARLMPGQKVELLIDSDDDGFLKKYGKQLEKETNTMLKKGSGEMEKLIERKFYIEIKH